MFKTEYIYTLITPKSRLFDSIEAQDKRAKLYRDNNYKLFFDDKNKSLDVNIS